MPKHHGISCKYGKIASYYNKILKRVPGVHRNQVSHLEPYLSGRSIAGGSLGRSTSDGVYSSILADESVMARQRVNSLKEDWRWHIMSNSQID
jgi:hypothetical protein